MLDKQLVERLRYKFKLLLIIIVILYDIFIVNVNFILI